MKKLLLGALCAGCLCACVNNKNLFMQPKDYLQVRNMQTKSFDTVDERQMLVASAQVLQDMGFKIVASETDLGLMTGQKNREVGSTAGKTVLTVLYALNGQRAIYEDKQNIYATLVTHKEGSLVYVRFSMARKSMDNLGNLYKIEQIKDPQVYRQFFEKLSQSVFLEANDI